MRKLYLALGLALGGCAATPKAILLERYDGAPIATSEDQRLRDQCSGEAQKASAGVGWQGPGYGGLMAQAMAKDAASDGAVKECLARQGVRAVVVEAKPKP